MMLRCYAATASVDKQFGSVGSAHYIKIGDGRLCMQWLMQLSGWIPLYLIGKAGCGCYGQLTHNSSNI